MSPALKASKESEASGCSLALQFFAQDCAQWFEQNMKHDV